MSLSAPRSIFGVHSFTPYSRTTGLFYGTVKVLKGSSISMEGELIEQMGGSSKFPWNVEDGPIKCELSLKFGQYEDFLFELFCGNAPTSNAAEANGSVTTLTNKYGTTLKHATTGIASVSVKSGSEADVKFGRYVVKAVSSTTVDVYLASDVDIGRGTDAAYQSDLLKITASPLTIASGAPVTIPNCGLELNGGSGTIGFTSGHTATFTARPQNTGSMDVVIGGSANQTFPEFGAVVIAQKRGNLEMMEVDVYRCKGAGMPLGFEANAWAEAEVKVKAFYDADRDGVFAIRHVKPT